MHNFRGKNFAAFFAALLVFFNSFYVESYAKGMKLGDVRILFGSKRCGENGVYQTKEVMWVIVIGSSGSLNCIINVTDKLLRASSFENKYVCVNSYEAKPAEIVSETDPRVLREAHYGERLGQAHKAGNERHVPVNVVYVTTSQGPPHPESRCRKMLAG